MLKSLFVGFYGDVGRDIITHTARAINFEVLDILANKVKLEGVDQEFIPKLKFRNGAFGFQEVRALPEVEPHVWERMAPYEIEFYKQVDRLGWSHQAEEYRTRYEFYKYSVKYFYAQILRRGYDFVFMSNVPHLMYDIVIYGLCKVLGVPVFYFYRAPIITDIFFYLYSCDSLGDHRVNEMVSRQKEFYSAAEVDSEVAEQIVSSWKSVLDRKEKSLYSPAKLTRLIAQSSEYSNNLDKKSNKRWGGISYLPIEKRSDEEVGRMKKSSTFLQAVYDSISVQPNLKESFIYFPLHMQPEATSQPLGGMFQDQSMAALLLAERIPDDWFVYVKEFPKQGGLHRMVSFYEELAQHPKIKLIDRGADTLTLTRASRAVATLTGTVAWEAFYSKKPAIVFGYTIIEAAKGVFKIGSKADLDSAIELVIEGGLISDKDLLAFSYALSETCFKGYLEPYKVPVKNCGFSQDENVSAIVKEIVNRVSEVAGEPL